MSGKISVVLIFVMVFALIAPIGIGALTGLIESKQNEVASGSNGALAEIGLTLSETEASIGVGSTKLLKATVESESDSYILQWDSSDKSVATVLKNDASGLEGVITGVAAGTAVISLNVIDKSQFKIVNVVSCNLTVVNTAIVFDKSEVVISLDKGNTATVSAEAPDGGAITWSSEDESIVTVVNGEITAHKAGQTYIVAKSGELESRLPVKVYNSVIALEDVKVVAKGENSQIDVSGELGDGAKWSVDDGSVASVDENGIVTGIKMGMTTVSVLAADGQTSSCVVIVSGGSADTVKLESGKKAVAASNPGNWYYLCESDIVTTNGIPTLDNGVIHANVATIGTSGANFFYLRYQPDTIGDVTYKHTLYIYADTAGVHQINGKDVTFKAGLNRIVTEYVSASPSNSNPYQIKLKTTGNFYFIPVFEEVSRVDKISLSTEFEALNLTDKTSVEIIATIPDGASSTLTWSSSNSAVATVDGGIVTAVGEGMAVISVTNGSLTSKCTIVVEGDAIVGTDIAKKNKSDVLKAPGKWFYTLENSGKIHGTPKQDADGNLYITVKAVNNSNLVYLRYQPEEQGSYTVTITIDYSGESGAVEVKGGTGSAYNQNLNNGTNQITYTFTSDSTTPFQIKFKSAGVYKINVDFVQNTEG